MKKVRSLGYRPEARPEGVAEVLRANPTDDSALIVHGDELLAAGDLRGELAALVTQGMVEELGRFLLANAPALFEAAVNDVHEGLAHELVWAPGFVRAVKLTVPTTGDAEALTALTRRFLSTPVAEFVRELEFGLSWEGWDGAAREVARAARHPELVTALRFEAREERYEDIVAGEFGELWPRFPALREFFISAGAFDPGELVLPELRSFSRLGGFSAREVRALTKARWPRLERMELGFLRSEEDAAEPDRLLAAVFQNPTLKHLALRDLVLSEDQVELLLDSEVLPRLHTLDLSEVRLDEDAAERLRDGAEGLAHLKKLSSPWLMDEEGEPTVAVLEDELENLVDDAFGAETRSQR